MFWRAADGAVENRIKECLTRFGCSPLERAIDSLNDLLNPIAAPLSGDLERGLVQAEQQLRATCGSSELSKRRLSNQNHCIRCGTEHTRHRPMPAKSISNQRVVKDFTAIHPL